MREDELVEPRSGSMLPDAPLPRGSSANLSVAGFIVRVLHNRSLPSRYDSYYRVLVMGEEVRTEENFFRWTITINSFTGRSLPSLLAHGYFLHPGKLMVFRSRQNGFANVSSARGQDQWPWRRNPSLVTAATNHLWVINKH